VSNGSIDDLGSRDVSARSRAGGPIWFDFENTPQVLFLEPFVTALTERGINVWITAKPQAQTLGLCRAKGLSATPVGEGNLTRFAAKVAGGSSRALALARLISAMPSRPRLLIHSSRTASLAALLMRVSAIGFLDYEHAIQWPLALASNRLWFPDILRGVPLPFCSRRVASYYDGLKENFYLDQTVEQTDAYWVRRQLGLRQEGERLVVARPPAEAAHYAVADSWRWWMATLDALLLRSDVIVVVVPRDTAQANRVEKAFAGRPGPRVLREVINGPQLIATADLVVGGGGTMNREAAVLGTHAWSTFCGPPPTVDMRLADEGRLTWIRSEHELAQALAEPWRRHGGRGGRNGLGQVLHDILNRIH
jgi:hypothetical protein